MLDASNIQEQAGPRTWGVWWWQDFSAVTAPWRRAIAALVVIFGILASIALIGGMSRSPIGLTDENDLPQYVGTIGHIAFSEIPKLLIDKTEVGQFGQSQRFRPIYWTFRLTETALWGLDGASWYRLRIAIFALVIAAMCWIYVECTGLVLGAIFTAYTLSFAMWVDIWTRSTGPNEVYASLGSAIYAIGGLYFVKRWCANEQLNASCLAMVAGAIIAMGSKENMLFLELPLVATFIGGIRYRRLDTVSLTALGIAIAFGAWIAASITVYFLGAKVEDIYGNSVQGSLLGASWMLRIYATVLAVMVAAALIELSLRRIGDADRLGRFHRLLRRYCVYASTVAAVFIFNFFFYTGHIPSGGRYDFPGVLAFPAALILLLHGLSEISWLFGLSLVAKKSLGLVFAVALVFYTVRQPWELPAAVKITVAKNLAFDAGLREAQRATSGHPKWPIFIKSFNYLDFETIQTLGFFFIAKSINNPRYLIYVENPYGEPRSAFQFSLEQVLQDESRDGMTSRGYRPLAASRIPSDGRCFVIVLRNDRQFAADQASGKDPAAGQGCEKIPMSIYWEGADFHMERPDS